MNKPLPEPGSEEWYILRDEFLRYVANEVNPARIGAGLKEIDMTAAKECFRVLDDFLRKEGA